MHQNDLIAENEKIYLNEKRNKTLFSGIAYDSNFYEDGLKYIREMEIFQGEIEGKDIWYFPNGNVYKSTELKKGKNNGTFEEYFENGNLYLEGFYLNDRQHGIWREYYENGNILEIFEMKYGELNGLIRTYLETGELESEGNYSNDVEHGIWRQYYINGNTEAELLYYYGHLSGKQIFYDESGNIAIEANLINGIKHGTRKEYYENGNIKAKYVYDWGTLVESKEWDNNTSSLPNENLYNSKFSFIDSRDENIYRIVEIGNQVWMAENLRYDAGIGSWFYENNTFYEATYGYLYDWETAQSVCPAGWHLPSDVEWKELASNLGGAEIAGGKLKETETIHWKSPNEGATNETRFNALPGGTRSSNNEYGNVGYRGFWWSSSELNDNIELAWEVMLSFRDSSFQIDFGGKKHLHSVRCLKD
ncbi:FISUMP domain-containing protein [Bacteroidota bacterium]